MSNKLATILGYILLFLHITATISFSAPKGRIKGTIRDVLTEDPLPYTNVILKGTSFGTASDMDGNYLIENIAPGTYTLRASYIGYEQEEISIVIVEGRTVEYNFSLSSASVLGDTLIVTAQAEGQKRAINEQLTSIAIKNVVSAARIQELPDANAAESVSRLPGVSIIRTGGEGSQVVVRGLSPQYNRVTIDGVELPANISSSDRNDHKSQYSSSDELSLSGDRASDLSMISSSMLGGIEVIKAITPDMDATVFGGVINFSMRKAVKTVSSVPQFEFLTQGSHNQLKNLNDNYKVVGSYEQRFFDNSFGLFTQISGEKKNLNSNELNSTYEFAGKLYVTDEGDPEFKSLNLADILRERDRYGATFVLDYTYETGNIGFMNFFSRSKTHYITRKESYELVGNDGYYNATNKNETLDAFSNLLSIKQSIGDIGVDLKLSHSFSGNDVPEEANFRFWQDGIGFTNKYNALRYASPDKVAASVVRNYEDADFFDISNVQNITKDRTLNASVDLYTDLVIMSGVTSKIKIGGAYNYRNRSYEYNENSGSVFYDDGPQVTAAILRSFPQFGNTITFSDLIDHNYSYGEFLNGDYTLGSPLDIDLMLKMMNIAKNNPGTGDGGGYKQNKFSSLYYDYSGNENRTAGYAMMTFNIGQEFTILPGVRYQNLTTTYTGKRALEIPGNIQYTEATETQSHGYFLPMVHFRYKPLDWFQVHFAYTNTLNYADYNSIIPRYYVATNYVLYNNYRLKPATAENFDLIISFYSNEIGLFTIGGYKKRIMDLILPAKTYPKDFSEYDELYELMKNKTESYALLTYINSTIPIDVVGLETEWQANFWFLPEPFNGLVLNINYSHIFSKANYPKTYLVTYVDENYIQHTTPVDTNYSSRLLNQPNDIMNIGLGYDYRGFSIRVSMLYQDNIFKKPDFWYQNRGHSQKYIRFDLSAKQELPWYGINVFFNLNNIGGEDDTDINQKTGYTTLQERYGMTADLGLRVSF